MAMQGPKAPAAVADDPADGIVAWTGPGNAAASDGVYATAALSSGSPNTHWLKATDFGFNIPLGDRILGVVATIERKESATYAFDQAVQLVVGGVVIPSENKAVTTEYPLADGVQSYGGASDTWGVGLTPADIDAGFGVAVRARRIVGTPTVSIDAITMTVYTASGDGQITVVQFCSSRPPHAPEITEVPSALRYGFKVRGVQTASFLLPKTSANLANFLDRMLPNEPAMVRIRRPDGMLPWVGFVSGIDEATGDPYATFQLADHAWRLSSPHGARTTKSQEYNTASGRIIQDAFRDMEQRGEPPLHLKYDQVADGPPASHAVRLDYGLDLLEALAKQCAYEWGFSYALSPSSTETHLTWQERQGVDRRGEDAWKEGTHFTAATYSLRYAHGILSAVAVGGSGTFADRPAVGVSKSGAGGDLTAAYQRNVSSYGLGGTRIVQTQQTSDTKALATMANQLHDAPEWAAEAFTFRVLEKKIDMRRFGLGDIRTIKRTVLGRDIERVVRIIGIDMNPETREHDVSVVVVG